MPTGVANISPEYLLIAREFLKQEPFFKGPRVPRVLKESRAVYSVGTREFSVASGAPYSAFLLSYLRATIGQDWIHERVKAKRGRKHPIIRILAHASQYETWAREQSGLVRATHYVFCGAQRELYTLADDMVTLDLIGSLPSTFVRRLRIPAEYQGVRYELAVAACFARAGFKIEWLPSSSANPEFVADHPITGEQVAVEAKSRGRNGDYQFVGHAETEKIAAIGADIAKLYADAATKHIGARSFAIFINANVPYRAHTQPPLMGLEGLSASLDKMQVSGPEIPAPEFFMCVTTCGWYYCLSAPAAPVRVVSTFPKWTIAAPRNFNTYVALLQGVASLYTVPQSDDFSVPMNPELAVKMGYPPHTSPVR